ncbi:hypothetical protein A2U01_0036088, partial [Trifolium medium]|nr:hypothetical protein [Trifolium medium]
VKSPKIKKEKVASKGPGPVEKISHVGGSAKTFIPTETSHLPISPSVDAEEFIDDHYSFNWEDDKIQNMDLEEEATLMLSHELRGILMGRIVTHKAAAMVRKVRARRAELNDAKGKMKEAEDSACAFEGDLKKIQDFLKNDMVKRYKLEEDQRQEINGLKEKLQDERSRVNEVKTLLEDVEQSLKLKDEEISKVKIDRANAYLDGFDFAIVQVKIIYPAQANPFKVIKDGKLVDQE